MKKSIAAVLFLASLALGLFTNFIASDLQSVYDNYKIYIWILCFFLIAASLLLVMNDADTSSKSIVILQQQEDELQKFVALTSNLEVDINKSTENINSYAKELEIINTNKDKYLQDELRSRLIRWVDKIENEIDLISLIIRRFNSQGRITLEFIKHSVGELRELLHKASHIDQIQIIQFIRYHEECRSNMTHQVIVMRMIIYTLQASFSTNNTPRRIKIATESFVRELSDIIQIMTGNISLIEEVIQLVKAKLH